VKKGKNACQEKILQEKTEPIRRCEREAMPDINEIHREEGKTHKPSDSVCAEKALPPGRGERRKDYYNHENLARGGAGRVKRKRPLAKTPLKGASRISKRGWGGGGGGGGGREIRATGRASYKSKGKKRTGS